MISINFIFMNLIYLSIIFDIKIDSFVFKFQITKQF